MHRQLSVWKKKDGSMRLCIDFCEVNKKTVPDQQPIPRVQDIMDGRKLMVLTARSGQSVPSGIHGKGEQAHHSFCDSLGSQ